MKSGIDLSGMKTVHIRASAIGVVPLIWLGIVGGPVEVEVPTLRMTGIHETCMDSPVNLTWRDPELVSLRPTQSAPGSRGSMTLTQPTSPFGVTVNPVGNHVYDVTVQVDQLRRRRGAVYVVWAAMPELDEYIQLGALGASNTLTAPLAWNKFMVFVSEEANVEVERWKGPILLTGLSPSGRMHTMAGHGPFEDVSCQQYY